VTRIGYDQSTDRALTMTASSKSYRKSNLSLFAMVCPFVAIILTQAAAATFSMQMVSSLRAYVTGESLWSKGQHHAIYHLGRYISTGDKAFLARFDEAMTYPLGDREARLALEASPPDVKAAEAGFLKGGNHPSDVPGLIWLFQHFSWFSYMDAAIQNWRVAEAALLELNELADDLRGQPEAIVQSADLRRLDEINNLITPLTTKFSISLGEGTRFVQSALLIANLLIAAVFTLLTLFRLNHFVNHRRQIEDELAWRAAHDNLTSLPNRSAFEQALELVLKQRSKPMTLMFLDLDQFKLVNDTGGHAAGDELLRRVSANLQQHLGPDDILARLGGDEFGLILSDCSAQRGRAVAERLRQEVLAVEFVWQGQHHKVSASIGLVQLEDVDRTLAEALRAADLACYVAKNEGRNRVHVHAADNAAEAELSSDMGWVQRLHRALDEDRFELHAQSIASIAPGSGEGEHLELLLRLRDHDDGKLIPPGAFIPAAERFGMMSAIDRWVVRAALKTIASRGALSHRATYSINLSGVTLTDDLFHTFLRDTLARTGVAPELLCFEITETSAVANLERAVAFMDAMRKLGCRFALDDFGVGMSSLTYLKRLPVDYLKIDGSFVRDMLTDKSDRATVQMINHLAHMAGKKTIAEFVETPAILEALREMGVDYAQGYAISRPSPFLTGAEAAGLPERMRA
jgi:diguanylate cyclase (GGDEF)-like protein